MAHVLELAALGLQAQAGCPVTFSPAAPRKPSLEAGVFQVVFEYTEEAVGRLALELAESAMPCVALADTSVRPGQRLGTNCASSTKTCAWAHPPAPSCKQQWRAIFPIAA